MAIDIIRQLSAPAPGDRLPALRFLKNDIVGHIPRKEHWVRVGCLTPLVATVETDDHAAKLQALQILASFANAGAQFVPPLHAAGALPAVLDCLHHESSQVVLAALRVLRDIATASIHAPAFSPINPTSLADIVFAGPNLETLALILSQSSASRDVAAQITIVARLVDSLCRQERHQYALVNHGVLDALSTILASFAVAEGYVIPGAEILGLSEGLSNFIPKPIRPGVNLSDVLGAIGAIITDSKFRTCRLLYSPSILAVFPVIDLDMGILSARSPAEPLELAGWQPTRQKDYDAMDLLLPYMPAQLRGQAGSGSTLPSLSISDRVAMSKFNPRLSGWNETDDGSSLSDQAEEAESPLVPWLINLVRNREGRDALTAASVLISLYKCGFAYKVRESTLGLLVVPKLLQLLYTAEAACHEQSTSSSDSEFTSEREIVERTPAVLARLITDCESLQKTAVDSNAIKVLCKLLKATYEPLPTFNQPLAWSPDPDKEVSQGTTADTRLGEPGQHPLLNHRSEVRESTLKAIGALAAFREDFRKAIVEQDTIPYVVESLSAAPGPPKRPKEQKNSETRSGASSDQSELGTNSNSVIIAACYATRMLSRSVSNLRTSLVDNGVAMPLFHLLRHPDVDVQIAATAAVCNMVCDFSPMRESLIRAGILKVLCDHARSLNAQLRLNALWALKHLVHAVDLDLKKSCLDELQPGWLVQLICDDTEDEAVFSARSKSDNFVDDFDEDMDMEDQSRSTATVRPLALRVPVDSPIIRLADSRLATYRDEEMDPVRKARQDDRAIQEQGLGFIRNLIGSVHASSGAENVNETADMIDHLFNILGQDRFFNILARKLRIKVLHPFSGRRGSHGNETRVLYPQTKIIEAVVYILVHMAASIPRHRQLVIAQTELLKLLASLFNSQDREVRVALCHLLNNLTWQDDSNDANSCSQRAVELKKLGFLTKLENLGHDDELDVRERAKSALWQMKHNQG